MGLGLASSRGQFIKVLMTAAVAYISAKIFLINPKMAVAGMVGMGLTVWIALKSPLLFLILEITLLERFYKIWNPGLPIFYFTDLVIVNLFIAIGVSAFVKGIDIKGLIKTRYFVYIVALVLIVQFCILFGTGFILQQPAHKLIFRSRPFFAYFIFVYLFISGFNYRNLKTFIKYVVISSVVMSLLIILDSKVLGGGHIFKAAVSETSSFLRAGTFRITTYGTICTLAYFILLGKIKFEKTLSQKVFYIALFSVIAFQIYFCNLTRQTMAVMFVSTMLFLFTFRMSQKVLLSIFIGFVMLSFALTQGLRNKEAQIPYLTDLYNETVNELHDRRSGSYTLRKEAAEFYYPYFRKSFFLGFGIPSPTYPGSPVIEGIARGYHLADLAFITIIYEFGVFGVVYVLYVLAQIFKDLCVAMKTLDQDGQIIACALFYLFLGDVIFFPKANFFFFETKSLYYGLMFYIFYLLVKETNRVRNLENAKTQDIQE